MFWNKKLIDDIYRDDSLARECAEEALRRENIYYSETRAEVPKKQLQDLINEMIKPAWDAKVKEFQGMQRDEIKKIVREIMDEEKQANRKQTVISELAGVLDTLDFLMQNRDKIEDTSLLPMHHAVSRALNYIMEQKHGND